MLYNIQGVPGGKVNILGGHSIGHSKKKVYMNVCPIPNGFRYLGRSILNLAPNIFLPSLSMSNHNSQLTLHTDSHAPDIDALRWEGRKILRPKYRKPFEIGHTFIYTFFRRMTDTMISQNIDLSSWDILYIHAVTCCSNLLFHVCAGVKKESWREYSY
jgi:hypothetical protein